MNARPSLAYFCSLLVQNMIQIIQKPTVYVTCAMLQRDNLDTVTRKFHFESYTVLGFRASLIQPGPFLPILTAHFLLTVPSKKALLSANWSPSSFSKYASLFPAAVLLHWNYLHESP